MKKQSSRARAQSAPPVRHQLDHAVPTVIHNPEQDMTALGRWAHHAMLEPRRYLGWPLAVIGGLVLIAIAMRFATGGPSDEGEIWNKLEAAKAPAERVDIAKANPKSPASTWAKLQAATEFFNQALGEMPKERDAALSASKKALDLFDEVGREAPHDSPQARVAAMGKARVLEMRNELPKAIEQYQLVAKQWPDTPEAEQARRYAEVLKDPQAADFYKELYAYTPTEVTLPPEGTVTFPPPGPGGSTSPASSPSSPASPPSNQPPALSPGLGAIPGLREIIEPKAGAPAQPAQPKAGTPEVKSQPAKSAATPKEKELPADVFSPEAGESKPK